MACALPLCIQGPSPPEELVIHKDKITESTITLSWKEPNPSDVPVVGYEVEYRKSGEEFKIVEKSLTHENLTCVVTGLAGHTEYEFRVAAIDSTGHGPFSDVVAQFTSKSCTYIRSYLCAYILGLSNTIVLAIYHDIK